VNSTAVQAEYAYIGAANAIPSTHVRQNVHSKEQIMASRGSIDALSGTDAS